MVRDVRCTFENILRATLEESRMDSDESLFQILITKYLFLFPTTINNGP